MKRPLLLILGLSLSTVAKADFDSAGLLEQSKQQFANGSYGNSQEILGDLNSNDWQNAPKDQQAQAHYIKALAFNKLQNYDSANEEFSKSAALGKAGNDFDYNYGQALFSAQKFDEAKKAFKRSIIAKYKVGASAYYIAYTAQITEDVPLARDFYTRIQRMQDDADQVKQASLLQLAELDFSDAQEIKEDPVKRKTMKEKIVGVFMRARDYDATSTVGTQADRRIKDVEGIIASLAPKMRNGVPTPARPLMLKLTQEIEYDTNVITKADESVTTISNQDSFILRPTVFTKYQFDVAQTFSFIPELNLTSDFYTQRGTPQVYQNDAVTMSPALRTKFEHMVGGSAATGIFDIESSYLMRDFQQSHHYNYYTRYVNLQLGERARVFSTGSTTLKFGYKFYKSHDSEYDAYTPSFNLSQGIHFGPAFTLQTTLSGDWVHARNDFNDERNINLRLSSSFRDFIGKWDLNPSIYVTMKDTLKQKAARGNEVMLNPSLEAVRDLENQLEISAKFAYTRNYSDDKVNYQYRKSVWTVGLNKTF